MRDHRPQQRALLCPWPGASHTRKPSPCHPRALPWAPTSLGYLLLPRDLAHQLPAHQEQFAWELGHPLNSLHQVPDHLEWEQEGTDKETRDPAVGSLAWSYHGSVGGTRVLPWCWQGCPHLQPPARPRPIALPSCPQHWHAGRVASVSQTEESARAMMSLYLELTFWGSEETSMLSVGSRV